MNISRPQIKTLSFNLQNRNISHLFEISHNLCKKVFFFCKKYQKFFTVNFCILEKL